MSIAQETPVTPSDTRPPVTQRNGRWSGYRHLLMVRMLELKREPEVVFWVFAFPLLLALGLGIAFRNKPADLVSVAIVAGSGSQDAEAMLARSPQHELFKPQILSREEAQTGFRLGKFDLVIEPDGKGGFTYRYDPARPETVLAKAEVNDALQAAAGRKDAVASTAVASSEPGSRYIDFLIPGLLGMNLMNSGMWGIGFALVDMRQRKLLKRYVATPMRRGDFLLALMSSRLVLMVIEIGLLLVFGILFFHMRVLGSVFAIAADRRHRRAHLRRRRPADRQPRPEDREHQRAHQPGDDAHVDLLRRLLLLRALPGRDPAADQGPASDRAQRRPARQHSGRHSAGAPMAAPADHGPVGWNFVRAGAEVVPLDVALRAWVRLWPCVQNSVLPAAPAPPVRLGRSYDRGHARCLRITALFTD